MLAPMLNKANSVFGLMAACAALAACGGGGGANPPSPTDYSVGGTLSGLASGASVVLQDNGSNSTTLTANGSFTFSTSLATGTAYAVSVLTNPTGQSCVVGTGSGTVSGTVTSVTVACATSAFTLSGRVTGLSSTGQLVLTNSTDSDSVTVLGSGNGSFTFATPVAFNGSYAITVGTQPTGQTCSVANATGSGVVANVTSIQVACAADTYTLSGTVSGLASAEQLVLINGGVSDSVTVLGSGNGSFTFATPVPYNGSYAVTVGTQPTGQTCSVANGTGSGVVANVTTVAVTCATGTYTLSGSLSGLGNGEQVTLLNNMSNPLTLTADGPFSFTTPVPYNGSYSVTVGTQPTGQICSVTGGSGSAVSANISSVTVTCGGATESVLYSFKGGSDGLYPQAGLIQGSDGNFYGTTANGGTGPGTGTVFKVTPAGVESVLHSFHGGTADGEDPVAGLIQGSDGNFYGTTGYAGTSNSGVVFKITLAGVESVLYQFTPAAGAQPDAGLIQGNDGNFYGTTCQGGTTPQSEGTVFKITPAGVESVLYSFQGGTTDGSCPLAGLIQDSDGNFYGTTLRGGTNEAGTVFEITPAGVEAMLYPFKGGTTDGSQPQAGLIHGSDGNFYGTTLSGGTNNAGTVFKITPAGVESMLYSFTGGADGGTPEAGLILGSDGNFYSTTYDGGTNSIGTIFKITPAGVESALYSFQGGADGAHPEAGLILGSDGYFYGTTNSGGTSNGGTVFKFGSP
jgi:uncharacterized repeat protein (TIGR03803 family)